MIVGTAGHVDHGKTTLVRALTGVDTDRLKEEKARGITIDLGFAYMPVPGGEPIGFVDVPGHEKLVHTMVAGAAAIDFALIVIAGDDGVMPQTREHLDILELLGLVRGLIVVTKSDRIDPARRATVAADIAKAVATTSFTTCDTLFVSAATGDGIDILRDRLIEAAATPTRRCGDGRFRLSVDRAFHLAGIGTVVTGTASSGRVAVNNEVVIMPGAQRARVRSLHVQNHEATLGQAGTRCALALSGSGIGKDIVGRGSWICGGIGATETNRFDADLCLLASEKRSLRDWTPVHLHVGASDVPARLVVLAETGLSPGQSAVVQVVLSRPLPMRHDDHFVIRDQSGQRTLGGGAVLDPRAPLRKRRSRERMARLDALRPNDPATVLGNLLSLEPGFEDLHAFAADRDLTVEQIDGMRTKLNLASIRAGKSVFAFTDETWRRRSDAIVALLADFHLEHPELPGMAGERLRLAVSPILPKSLFAALRDRLAADEQIALQGHWIRLPSHIAELSAADKQVAALVTPLIAEDRFRPPRVRDVARALGLAETSVRRACKALVRIGELVEIAHDHFFLRRSVVEMAGIADRLTRTSATGVFSAAEFRDKLDNGRKVAIQILEYFDGQRLTLRTGDLRRVVKSADLIFGTAEHDDGSRPPAPNVCSTT